MAQKVITQLVDDIDGKVLTDGEGETVAFGLDGTTYEIDLSKNADKLRGLFQDYIAAGRKTGGKRTSRSSSSRSNAAEIRAWAKDKGMEVPDRGRIPADVRDAWDARDK
jgi:hypothetical protein